MTAVTEVISCWRTPCSSFFNWFLARRMFRRGWSIQKSFNNGCWSVTPTPPKELSKGIPDEPYCSAMLPLNVYCNPDQGSVPVRPESKLFSSDTLAGAALLGESGLKPPGETL